MNFSEKKAFNSLIKNHINTESSGILLEENLITLSFNLLLSDDIH